MARTVLSSGGVSDMTHLLLTPCPRMKDGEWHLDHWCELCEGRRWVAKDWIDEEGERLSRQAAGEPQTKELNHGVDNHSRPTGQRPEQ